MKRLSFARKAVLLSLVLAAAAALIGLRAKDRLVRRFIVETLQAAGGFTVKMDRLHVGVLTPVLTIEGLTIGNPTNFPAGDALQIRRIMVRYDRWSLLTQSGQIPELELDVAKMVLVRTADGATNLEQWEANNRSPVAASASMNQPVSLATTGTASRTARPAASPGRVSPPKPSFRIARLRIKIDALDYYDYSMGGSEPMVIPAEIKFDQTFADVADLSDVMNQLVERLDPGSMLRKLGAPNATDSEEARKKTDREIDRHFERIVEGL